MHRPSPAYDATTNRSNTRTGRASTGRRDGLAGGAFEETQTQYNCNCTPRRHPRLRCERPEAHHKRRTFLALPTQAGQSVRTQPTEGRRNKRPLESQSPCSDAEAHQHHISKQTRRRKALRPSSRRRTSQMQTEAPPQIRQCGRTRTAATPDRAGGHGTCTRRVDRAHSEGCPEGNRSNRPQKRCPSRLPQTGRRRELLNQCQGRINAPRPRTSRSVGSVL